MCVALSKSVAICYAAIENKAQEQGAMTEPRERLLS